MKNIVAAFLVGCIALAGASTDGLAGPREKRFWQPKSASSERQQCSTQCRKETNCYPGECYLIGEELPCGPDNCVTRRACTPECR